MSTIILRENSPNPNFDETTKNSPLDSSEGDSNFQNLNATKLENDGSMPINGDLTLNGDLNSDNTSMVIETNATGQIISVTIDGDLTVNGVLDANQQSQSPVIAGKIITVDEDASNKTEADNAGLQIGSPSIVSLKYNSTNDVFLASDSDVGFQGNDFFTNSGESLLNNVSEIDSLRGFVGASDSFTPIYSSTNFVNNGDSLEDSIGVLDTELNDLSQIKTYTGADDGFSTSYTEDNTVSDGDSLETSIDKLDQITKFVVSKVSLVGGDPLGNNFSAVSSTLFLVTPNEGEEVICTLPSSNKGRLSVRLENDSLGRSVTVNGFSGDQIESLAVGEGITIDQQKFTVDFLWDETNSVWRVM